MPSLLIAQPRRALSIVPLTPKQKTALKTAYADGVVETELMSNLLIDMAQRAPSGPAPQFAATGLELMRAQPLEKPHFHFTGNRKYRNLLVTDGESFGLLSQETDGAAASSGGMSTTRLEAILSSPLAFAPVSQKPSKAALLRFHAAHVNWLFAQSEGIDPELASRARRMARALFESHEGASVAAKLFFEQGASAEAALGISFVEIAAPASSVAPETLEESPPARSEAQPLARRAKAKKSPL